VVLEQAFKDLPKHLTNLAESAVIVGRDLVDRLWKMKAEIDRRVANEKSKQEDTSTTKRTTTQSPTTKTTATSMFLLLF
jgi:hypothetical protein